MDALQCLGTDIMIDASLVVKNAGYWLLVAKLWSFHMEYAKAKTAEQFLATEGATNRMKEAVSTWHRWEAYDVVGLTESGQEKLVEQIQKDLESVAVSEMQQLKTSLLAQIRIVEGKVIPWKDSLDPLATWKLVKETATKKLLAPGLGAELQQVWKKFNQARLVICDPCLLLG